MLLFLTLYKLLSIGEEEESPTRICHGHLNGSIVFVGIDTQKSSLYLMKKEYYKLQLNRFFNQLSIIVFAIGALYTSARMCVLSSTFIAFAV